MKRNGRIITALLVCGLAATLVQAQVGFCVPVTLASGESNVSGGGGSAAAAPGSAQGGQQDLAEIGHKLANPLSDVWALFTEFDLYFSGGDLNTGAEEVGGRMLFQPVLPIPLHGKGKDEWKLITRPTIPVIFSQPVPTGFNDFVGLGGLGDTQLPLLIAPPTGQVLFGIGPTWLFPTATRPEFGQEQWGVGPAAVLGYGTKDFVGGVFPQYTFGIGGWGDQPDASNMSLLYFFIYHLSGGWDIGLNPTISYDHTASPGNQWNVPVGLLLAKMTKVGKIPVKLQLGVEYSVVSQDEFGQRAQIKLNVIPVIPGLIKNPVFGGK